MYIKLIQPKMNKRPMDTGLKLRMSPPLGLYTIAAILREEHKVVIINENIEKIDYDDMPDIVGITVTVDAYPRAAEIAKNFRRQGVPVVAGGIHITTAYEMIPEGVFDVLCIGAAENTWPDIMKDLSANCLKDKYFGCKPLEGKDIVSPAYDMIDKDKYLYTNILHTGRGCPFRCDFCYNSSKERYYVVRNIDDVIQEIKQMGKKHIMIIDDNFIGDPAWTRAFLKELKKLNLKWNAAVSVNVVNIPGLLAEMKESGCCSLFIGFESIQPDSVNGVHKVQNDVSRYEEAIRLIHSHGIMINASFVFGLDSDTKETFQNTLDFIVRNKIETVTSHIMTPYPGTVLYDRLKAEGRIITEDYSKYNTAHVVFKPKNLSADELYKGYLWMYRRIYSFKNIIKRIPDAKEQVLPYLAFNLFYRKFGKFTDLICKIVTYRRLGYFAEKMSKYI
ncbi:MAG: B12-binding domain-containing radical SAM protein [Lachnospiraceae bacterium]|nr:B12-binding domain-containing radical SAM protein [Lachnospiraceae bacterium]